MRSVGISGRSQAGHQSFPLGIPENGKGALGIPGTPEGQSRNSGAPKGGRFLQSECIYDDIFMIRTNFEFLWIPFLANAAVGNAFPCILSGPGGTFGASFS